MKNIGNIILSTRQAWGIDRQQFADKVGVSAAAIYNLENGLTNNPGVETFEKICKVLNVSPMIFFDDDFRKLESDVPITHLPPKHLEAATDPEFLPWIEFGTEMRDKGITVEEIRNILNVIFRLREQ